MLFLQALYGSSLGQLLIVLPERFSITVCRVFQVTALLDAVYGLFDNRISHYDVYKVETIGDAYMVVSGLPHRNGIRHADQIARMALDLQSVIKGLSLPEFSQPLAIRIGIHTGK